MTPGAAWLYNISISLSGILFLSKLHLLETEVFQGWILYKLWHSPSYANTNHAISPALSLVQWEQYIIRDFRSCCMSERRQRDKVMPCKKATLAAKQEKKQIEKDIKRKTISNSKHHGGKSMAKTCFWWLHGHMYISKMTSETLLHLPKIDNRSFSHASPCICKKSKCLKSDTSQSSKSPEGCMIPDHGKYRVQCTKQEIKSCHYFTTS